MKCHSQKQDALGACRRGAIQCAGMDRLDSEQCKKEFLRILEGAFATRQNAAKHIGVSENKWAKIRGGGDAAFLKRIKEVLDYADRTPNHSISLADLRTLRAWQARFGGARGEELPSDELPQVRKLVDTCLDQLAGQFTESNATEFTRKFDEAVAQKRMIEVVLSGNYVLQKLGETRKRNRFLDEMLTQIARRVRKAAMSFIGPVTGTAAAERARLLTVLLQELRLPEDRFDESPESEIERFEEQLLLFRTMVPHRSRMASLSWPPPYHSDWTYEGSKSFQELFCGGEKSGYLLIDEYRKQEEKPKTEPGAPRHGFYRASGFLVDARPDAIDTLYRLKCDVQPGTEYGRISPRIGPIAARILAGLIENGRLQYDGMVAISDVAPTHLNHRVTIRSEPFARSIVAATAMGIDSYNGDGSWHHDGLTPVAEDGRWMLLRSNHASKALRISVLLITSDHKLCFRLLEPHLLFDTPNWAPTFMGFAAPRDFEGCELLYKGIENAAERIVRATIPDYDRLNTGLKLVGFALNAGAGLQPNYVCIAGIALDEGELRERFVKEAGLRERRENQSVYPVRFHPLVFDNPIISFAEAYSLGRYSESDTLRMALFSSWRWFAAQWEKNEVAPTLEKLRGDDKWR